MPIGRHDHVPDRHRARNLRRALRTGRITLLGSRPAAAGRALRAAGLLAPGAPDPATPEEAARLLGDREE
ncbi:hypothetical protein HNR06_001632 [Nocardiopsis arvandica]|uniref:Uncharacterized protein n=1 Tax=Nocardiopsis sinuspersici TaxID=501010 RepID=A0A7Y9XAF9_9ACTN|nr:hypothetical protein [Nocardiopsis sinuspersici]